MILIKKLSVNRRRNGMDRRVKTVKVDDSFLRIVKKGIQNNGRLLERLAKK